MAEVLKKHKTKQNKDKLVLGEAYKNNDLLFCLEDGTPLEPRNFTREFDRLIKKSGLPKIRFHDLRHTFATIMLGVGEHPKVIQDILGHLKITTTLDIYSHVFPDLKKNATAKMNTILKPKCLLNDNNLI